jgi:hypothetical protein
MKKASGFSLFLFTIGVCLVSLGALAGGPTPQYWPTCPSPQNIAPMQTLGGGIVATRSSVVWNGQNFAAVWVDGSGSRLHFQKVFADGTLCGAEVIPSLKVASTSNPPSLVWTGNGYGVAWVARATTYFQVYFARLYADGTLNGSEVKVSFYGTTETLDSWDPVLAWSGSTYAVAWDDFRNGNNDIFATILNASGGVVAHDLAICNNSSHQFYPSISWSKGAGKFVVAWEDARPGHYVIYASSLSSTGTASSNALLVDGGSASAPPVLADSGSGLGMAWSDFRDGNYEIYFARINAAGSAKIGSDIRLTNDTVDSVNPWIVWTGVEFGVFWDDNRSGNSDIWFERVGAGGGTPGINKQVTTSAGITIAGAAFGQYGFMVTGAGDGGANYVLPWGCNDDTSAPSCPRNFYAYSVTGTTAVVGWIPSVEDYTDIAFYEVYRNSVLIVRTSATLYADTGLTAGNTYNYYIRPVNAADLINGACTDSIYLKTNASLILTVNKSDPDARLIWTDAGMNTYNIYRGTNPQVMSKIGETAGRAFDDENALLTNVVYYYTVDEPGW